MVSLRPATRKPVEWTIAGASRITRMALAASQKPRTVWEAAVFPPSELLSLWFSCCTIPGAKWNLAQRVLCTGSRLSLERSISWLPYDSISHLLQIYRLLPKDHYCNFCHFELVGRERCNPNSHIKNLPSFFYRSEDLQASTQTSKNL